MKLIDLSQTIDTTTGHMVTFNPSVPQPKLRTWQSHEDSTKSGVYSHGVSCEISVAEFVTSMGTYIDAPYHFHPDMNSIDMLPLQSCVLPGIVIDCTPFVGMCYQQTPDAIHQRDHQAHTQTEIPERVLSGFTRDQIAGKAVLLHTGYDKHWKTDVYLRSCPYIGLKLTNKLIELGAKLVGIDCLVVDSATDPARPCHHNLLKNEILIVENMCHLDQLLEDSENQGMRESKQFIFHAAPVKYQGAAAFPVRAYATILTDTTSTSSK